MSEVRQELEYGAWRNWLKKNEITKSTANRWIRISEFYLKVSQIGTYKSVNEAYNAIPKREKPAKVVEPELVAEGEASSGTPEEATGGEDPRQLPLGFESTQELPDKLRETDDKLPVGEKEVAELRQENTKLRQEKTDLLKEIERLKCLLEENRIPWESTPDDHQKKYSPAA